MTKQTTKFIKQFIEQVNQRSKLCFDEFLSPDVIIHGPASGQSKRGIAAIKEVDSDYDRAYPQQEFFIEDIQGIKDKVYVRWVCVGLHRGKVKGISPKNPHFKIEGQSIYRIQQGKIVEAWQSWDRLGMLEQIGEISVRNEAIEPGYYLEILKSMGMGEYADQAPRLSTRERQCLRCLLEGKTAKETANLYNISYRTVETFIDNLKKKMQCKTKKELFKAAKMLENLELL